MAETPHYPARYWEAGADGKAHCRLCPHHCALAPEAVGICRVRKNLGGKLFSLNYGEVCSAALDPIEKKPLFHFFPGRMILSLGTLGCNLSCGFCQNWQISQQAVPTEALAPPAALALAKTYAANLGIAYTYNEPFIWYEFVLDTAKLVREAGLKNVLVTNGYVEEAPLRELLPYIDAMNVDIKSMQDDFYRKLCGGRAGPSARTVEIAHQAGCLVEVTNLIIPGWNDAEEDFRTLTDWLAGIAPDIPLHFSRYHPAYKLQEPATPRETLQRARAVAREKLHYVYLGNCEEAGGEDTVCPGCQKPLLQRRGFTIVADRRERGRCQSCGSSAPIVET
jgi:pyruvate formate lyase activating enzyme